MSENQVNTEKLLTKKDIRRSWMLWLGTCEMSNSFERLQSLSFVGCLAPILKKLYKDDEQLKLALKRHLTFFNTEGIWGSLIHGIVIAMEEERAKGEDISDDMITGLKTGFMGPLAGIGDTVDWGTIRPIVIGLFLPLASAGSWIAGLGPFVVVSLITSSISYYLWHLGYKVGRKSILQVLKDGRINQFITASSILGMFMMGILSSQYVKLELKPSLIVNAEETTIQSYIDQILPGLLPIAIVFVLYYLIKKKNVKYTTILLGVLVFSLLGALVGLF
ncbi:PTS system mannose/fructose/sorbose family transporter subunit IID [Enterococcus sp. AZ109]|uniref:PTS system mannose/fructose/sorbose family transporter subunit IID n=1 Tax=Enterococcus sp. AZ109 TaxID=2774634 RepID=UPI003F2525F4